MAASVNKTQRTDVNPVDFIATVESEARRSDGWRLLQIMKEETGEDPYMYGPSIVGFGSYHYVYDSGREGDAPISGFSPRKAHLVLYLLFGFDEASQQLLDRLGPHKEGKSCLYIRKLADIDETVLREMIRLSHQRVIEEQTGC